MNEESEPIRDPQAGPREIVYDEQIEPLVMRIKDICEAHDVDYIMWFALDPIGEEMLCSGATRITRPDLDKARVAAHLLHGHTELHELETGWMALGIGDEPVH